MELGDDLRYGYQMIDLMYMRQINANGQLVYEQYLYQMMTSKSNIRAMQWFDAATSTFDVNCSCGTEYPNNLYYTFLALLQLIHVNWPNSIILFHFQQLRSKNVYNRLIRVLKI